MSYKKDMKKREGRFISLAWFRAYDKELSEFWIDDVKPLVGQVELRCLDICHTIIIHDIKIIDLQK